MSESQSTRRRGISLGRAIPVSTLPNIIEAPFPERRTIHWLPPDRVMTEEFSIVVTSDVLLQTSRHVAQTLEHEMGGFLLGNRYQCPNTGREYIIIDQYVEADFAESTDVSLTFTHEAWGQLEDQLTGKYYGKKLVGWYHSHPGMSIFLSEHDLVIHRDRFPEPWMVALVLEPEKHLGGFFVWSNGKVDPNQYVNFFELIEGERRESVVAWKNYNGHDPVKGIAPVLSPENSGTPRGTEANLPVPTTVPEQPPVGHGFPDWLHGNVLWFGGAAIALSVFLVVLYIVTRPPKPVTPLVTDVFRQAKVTIADRGEADFANNTILVKLKLSGLPEEVADKVKTRVSIEGQPASILLFPGDNEVSIEASVRSKDTAKRLAKSRGQDAQLLVKAAFEYKDNTHEERLDQRTVVLDGDKDNLAFANFPPVPIPQPTNTGPPTNQDQQNRARKDRESQDRYRQDRESQDRERHDRERQERDRQDRARQDQQNKEKEAAASRNDDNERRVQVRKAIEGLTNQLGGLEDKLKNSAPNSKEHKDLQKQVQRTRSQLDKENKKLKAREN